MENDGHKMQRKTRSVSETSVEDDNNSSSEQESLCEAEARSVGECDDHKSASLDFEEEDEDMVPSSSTLQTPWETRFEELKKYKNEHDGDTNVSKNSGPLGRWVDQQRTQFREFEEGKKSSLTDERRAKLNGIKFEFHRQTRISWDTRFQELKEFKEAHGHTIVVTKSGPLGVWVSSQRTHVRLFHEGKASSMTAERLAKLNGLSFQFNVYSERP
jgi:hypothetical protein